MHEVKIKKINDVIVDQITRNLKQKNLIRVIVFSEQKHHCPNNIFVFHPYNASQFSGRRFCFKSIFFINKKKKTL